MAKLFQLALVLISPTVALSYGDKASADAIDYASLPGADGLEIGFASFAGYLTLPGEHGKQIFYWFFEAEELSPEDAPVTFWTNGGPGCSGFLGLFTEHGPLRPTEGGKRLELNPFSWNKRSNMLYVEQPAGVGFSIADDEEAYNTNDKTAAQDNYMLIKAFLERFPEFRPNDFYITSESYGGHYMPTLALEILRNNPPSSAPGHINFKGMAVGNPYTQAFSNNVAMYEAYWGHQLVSKPTFDKWEKKCTGKAAEDGKDESLLSDCLELEAQMTKESATGGPVKSLTNPYAMDYPVCLESSEVAQQAQLLKHILHPRLLEMIQSTTKIDYQPCEEDWTISYLNRKDVKRAIHAQEDINWTTCSNTVNYDVKDMAVNMAPLYNTILKMEPDLKILVFSGDDDAVCATWGTQFWIFDLGYDTSKYWRRWTTDDGQLGGFYTQFKDVASFGFATVHRAGHEVPAYTPMAGLQLFNDFLSGKWFH